MTTIIDALQSEYDILLSRVIEHREHIDIAYEVFNDALENACIPTQGGKYTIDVKKEAWRYPAVHEALQQVEALTEDDGLYWAESRIRDLERILGLGYSTQMLLPFSGLVPDPHPAVKVFLS